MLQVYTLLRGTVGKTESSYATLIKPTNILTLLSYDTLERETRRLLTDEKVEVKSRIYNVGDSPKEVGNDEGQEIS